MLITSCSSTFVLLSCAIKLFSVSVIFHSFQHVPVKYGGWYLNNRIYKVDGRVCLKELYYKCTAYLGGNATTDYSKKSNNTPKGILLTLRCRAKQNPESFPGFANNLIVYGLLSDCQFFHQ